MSMAKWYYAPVAGWSTSALLAFIAAMNLGAGGALISWALLLGIGWIGAAVCGMIMGIVLFHELALNKSWFGIYNVLLTLLCLWTWPVFVPLIVLPLYVKALHKNGPTQ